MAKSDCGITCSVLALVMSTLLIADGLADFGVPDGGTKDAIEYGLAGVLLLLLALRCWCAKAYSGEENSSLPVYSALKGGQGNNYGATSFDAGK